MKTMYLALAMFFVMVGGVFAADLRIDQVMVDPINTESGGEFVRIVNYGVAPINLSGYTLRTETSFTDVTLPDYSLGAGKYFLITDTNWDAGKDNAEWPDADHKEDMSLTNTNAGVALVYGEEIVDAVGWGISSEIDEGLYEGTPVINIETGLVLKRQTDTGNNVDDFVIQNASFVEEDKEGENIEFIFNISNSAPSISKMTLTDDVEGEGIQILPSPGESREVYFEINATDKEGDSLSTEVILNNETYSFNGTNGTLYFDYFMPAGNYTANVIVTDSSGESVSTTLDFEYLELVSIGLDTNTINLGEIDKKSTFYVDGDLDWETFDKPTVKNLGNVELDLGLSGSDFVDGLSTISIQSLGYSVSDFTGSLTNELEVVGLNLVGGDVTSLGFDLTLPEEASQGNYKGSVTVVGVVA